MLGHRIWGKRLGIIGMGRIGQAVARRAKAFTRRSTTTTGAASPGSQQELEATCWRARPGAGAHGHRVSQLPAHAGHLSSALARRLSY
jgi:lactate dehydrogenase-like 2-hydroxyacid dehydrogenase